jgi:two-component system phosphate regulon sensor histidine kinase PhoR
VEIKVAESDRFLSLSVSDSGPGVPKEEREHIFERFYQINRSANSKNPGSGLGLSIAKHMIDQLSGTILVSENRGGGALFTLRFPVRKSL